MGLQVDHAKWGAQIKEAYDTIVAFNNEIPEVLTPSCGLVARL